MPYFSQIRSSFMSRSRFRLQSAMNAPPRSEMSGTATPRRTTQSSLDDLVTFVSVRLGLAIGSSSQDRQTAYHALGCRLDMIVRGLTSASVLASREKVSTLARLVIVAVMPDQELEQGSGAVFVGGRSIA